MSELVVVERRDHVAIIRLNNPKALNALGLDMARALSQAFKEVAEDDQTRAVVLSHAGSYFMAGGDIQYMGESLKESPEVLRLRIRELICAAHDGMRALRRMKKPVIAAVRGGAAGIGVSLVAACDLVVVAEDAKFTLAYTNLGTTPDGGATWLLTRLLGQKLAMELVLLNRPLGAEEARVRGLVNEVVAADLVEQAAEGLASRLTGGAFEALGNAKALIYQADTNSYEQQLELEENSFAELSSLPNFSEGVTAFLEKRKPGFNNN